MLEILWNIAIVHIAIFRSAVQYFVMMAPSLQVKLIYFSRIDYSSTHTGCNVENAAYSGSICAERTAIVKAVSSGHRKFKAIAITSNLPPNDLCAPCGNCRQFLVEVISDYEKNISQ